jgi:regulator of RNase E activity RraA
LSDFRSSSPFPTTPQFADACLRLGVEPLVAPPGIVSIVAGVALHGPALPVRHAGSVDVFLEVLATAEPGDVLVIDNDGRHDEGCIGDLTVLEAMHRGIAGIVVWGRHRDTAELHALGLPVFSLGAVPTGPRRIDPRPDDVFACARIGELYIMREHHVVGDADGVLFLPRGRLDELLTVARQIAATEAAQSERLRAGEPLYEQLGMKEYLEHRAEDPDYTFRDHLGRTGGAIEE